MHRRDGCDCAACHGKKNGIAIPDLVRIFTRSGRVFQACSTDQKEIFDTEKFDTLRSLEFFKNFSDVELWDVLRISKWRKASESEQVLREGETGRPFYVLAEGTVRVVKQGKWLCLLHRGDCFGEMAHLADQDSRRSADVIAKTDVLLIEINPDALTRATTGCRFQFVDAFLHILVKRLTAANTRISFWKRNSTSLISGSVDISAIVNFW